MNFPVHRTEIRVTYAESDAMAVVYHANYLRWFEIGRTEWLRSLGLTYRELEEQGVYLPVSEAFCKYIQSARYDDLLEIETAVVFLKRASIQFSYRVLRKADGVELAQGTTLHAFVDRAGKIVKVPARFKDLLEGP
jgi:acyl-CoA thioester hydrolase